MTDLAVLRVHLVNVEKRFRLAPVEDAANGRRYPHPTNKSQIFYLKTDPSAKTKSKFAQILIAQKNCSLYKL